jgi:hypothetical protein
MVSDQFDVGHPCLKARRVACVRTGTSILQVRVCFYRMANGLPFLPHKVKPEQGKLNLVRRKWGMRWRRRSRCKKISKEEGKTRKSATADYNHL